METIQVVLETKLLHETDAAARRAHLNRSALIRAALRQHLQHLKTIELEDLDRAGYTANPQDAAEVLLWEAEAAWPRE